MKTNYNRTVQACFIGYVVQAIVNNFVPLLFLTFQGSYGISLQKITLLVTFNFDPVAGRSGIDWICGQNRLSCIYDPGTCNGGCRSDFAHSIAGVPGRSVCGTSHCSYDLCHRRRIAGGAGKSCGGSLPYR